MFTRLGIQLKTHALLYLALGLALLVFYRLLGYGHISWDDPEMVFRNKAVKGFDVHALLTGHYVGNYLPVTMLLHALNWILFGTNDGGHHAVNILLHLANGVLVYQITLKLFQHRSLAGFCVLIFLLHPLQLESVCWISEMKNTLSAFFFFASLLTYLRYLEQKRGTEYLLCFVLFIAACLSKSSAVILPLCLLCLDVFLKKDIHWSFILNKTPFFLLSVFFGLVNLKTQAADLFINYSHAFPYYERLGYAGFALLKYVGMFLIPVNLSVLYPYPAQKISALVIGYIFLSALLLLLIILFRRRNYHLIALIFLCLSNLVLVLQFIPFGEVLYADRYMYVPLVFFTLLGLNFLRGIYQSLNYPAIGIALILAVLSHARLNVWKSSVYLYSDILKKFPNSFVALNSLGAELMLQNEDQRALEVLNKSIRVSPQNYKGYYNKGLLLLKTQKPLEAISSFNRSIALYDYPKAYVGRASAYFMRQDFSKAMADANYVLQKDPSQAKAYFILGNCFNSLNQVDSAIANYTRGIELVNDDADFYFKRGIAYGKKQAFNACYADLNQCIELNPVHSEAYYWRGVAKLNLGLKPCDDFREAAKNNSEAAIQAYSKYCH
ncbi:MAG TPA: tetratricopeptide repeat protein [Bacteroidia bacterium]|nr:tetratricopeptide repeat protein [Bacteroidia bacterium]